ncbi:ABC transporter G family member [Striga asiatica]|uniref:ABC transporter G family member n=1 Tax=Striga asiatica TaxID=4170 RepID=A0A5A7QAL0_STRAF|nr:ABC transporter G family member [Striga asiatica]
MEIEVSDGGGEVEAAPPRHCGEAYLVWQDLNVVLPKFGQQPIKNLLNGLNGYAGPGRIMAIMGPSGSGKSTLLDSLAVLFFVFWHAFSAVIIHVIHFTVTVQDRQIASDPLMNLTASDIRSTLVEKYKQSEYAKMARIKLQEFSKTQELELETLRGSQATFWKQLPTLTQRSFVNMFRDSGYYWSRLVTFIIVSLCVGTLFYDVGTSYTAIFARRGCAGFMVCFISFMSAGGFQSFVEEMKVFFQERINGYYGVGVFILSNFISSFPFLVAMSAVSGAITYYMVFEAEFSRFVFYSLNLFGCIAMVESVMMTVAALVPHFLMGILTGSGVLPIWRYPVSFIGYGSWALQGEYKNALLGLMFDPIMPGDPKITGEYVVKDMFGVSLSHSKWWDLVVLHLLFVIYRVIFFLLLKLKETRFASIFRSVFDKRILHYLKRHP